MKNAAVFDPVRDPFGERIACALRTRAQVLGGVFEFRSNDRRLLRLVDMAFKGLPAQRLAAEPLHFKLQLLLMAADTLAAREQPPRMKLCSGAGLLCGTMDSANFAIVAPRERAGLVAMSRDMLGHPYHARYELIEFAVYTLASRAQQLVSLHAACVGREGRGLLMIGASGAGKSTLTLHCLLQGMELIAEDGVLVATDGMLATGIGSFLHLRHDSLRFVRQAGDVAWISKSPVIRRRSGVAKLEVDLRGTQCRIARAPPKIVGVVFLSKRKAGRRGARLSVPLSKTECVRRLVASQPYAANQPEWAFFRKQLSRIDAFELRRGSHPSDAAEELQCIVADY